jgi:hypothetical protein
LICDFTGRAMSEFETLQLCVTALRRRLSELETKTREFHCACEPCLDAQDVAKAAGIDPGIMRDKKRQGERKGLARALQGAGWGAARIARVLFCSERTVERWLQSKVQGPKSKGMPAAQAATAFKKG